MKNSEQYIIRDYKKGDEELISALFYEVFEKKMTVEQWNWKYAIPGNGRIYSKVAVDSNNKIVGHAGAIPLRGICVNEPIQFFQGADVMVDKKARGFLGRKNAYELLMKALLEDIAKEFPKVFCYGFSGMRPFILGKRVGIYNEIEQAIDCIKGLSPSFFNTYRMKPMSWDDDILDTLWARLSDHFSFSLIRDKAYLSWRYATNPFFSYRLLGFFLLGKLKGWVVIIDSESEVFVVDLLTEKKRCRGILNALQNHLISQGKKTMRLWIPKTWRKDVKGCNESKTDVTICNLIWKMSIQTSFVRENYFYTMGDTDIF
jgi:hypothetical protein